MTDEQITRLFELKKRLDAGEISKEMFDLGVSAIHGTEIGNDSAPSSSNNSSNKRIIIIGVIIAVVVLLCGGLYLVLHNQNKTEDVLMCPSNVNFPDENRIRNVVSSYCTAICENDFEALTNLYAPKVLRYQDAYDKDRDYVIGCHQRYDNTFKVFGKHSSLRWDSFKMDQASSGFVNVVIIEDYSIDRQDKSKYSVFVLEKHFTIDSTYHIVSVYDNQLSKSKGSGASIEQLAAESFKYLLKEYARGANPIEVGEVYDRVDFRKDAHFMEFIRMVVESDSDFQILNNGSVMSTVFMDMASGKIGSFTIQGTNYTIDFSQYMGEDIRLTVRVNGHQYEYESPDYLSSPLYPEE